MISSKIYRALTDTAYCFTIVPYILNHKYRTNKYANSVNEKFGLVSERSQRKKCLQIHAVSVGEVIAAEPIIKEFLAEYPEWDIHITVSTATGKEVAQKRYPQFPVSYFPLDLSIWVKRFFSRIRPSAILLMELEIWPNFLSISKEFHIPVLVANGRITKKSAEAYIKYKWFPILKQMLNIPQAWLAQNQEYAQRFEKIGVNKDKIQVLGSVKYDTIPTDLSQELQNKYRQIFNADTDTKLIVAGSTHSPEESLILKAYSEVASKHPNTKLILAPRHPHRFEEVYKEGCKYGNCAKYSELKTDDTKNSEKINNIIVIDKMGVLSELYNAADIVFIGGSFIEHGGQNMLETCGIGKPTVIGPSYYNFSEPMEVLKAAKGIVITETPDDLGKIFLKLISDSASAAKLGSNGREALITHKGCAKRTVEALSRFLTTNL